ncbi:MAG TPA: hypothetical protein VID27_08550 [Blastocatellia bacterium]|jgi:hypothetical protein
MQFLTVRNIFALLLIAGCLTVAVARINYKGSSHQLLANEEVIPLIFLDGKKCFVPVGAADGYGSTLLYQSLDGVKASYSGARYSKHTERTLRGILKALKEGITIERGPIINDAGQVIGERIVFVYQNEDNGRQAAIILSTFDDGFTCIYAGSLEHALNLEKWREQRGW